MQDNAKTSNLLPDEELRGTGTLRKDIEAHLRQYYEAHSDHLPAPGLYWRVLPLIEKPLIEQTLKATAGNQIKAAAVLGINRNTLRKKIAELGIVLSEVSGER